MHLNNAHALVIGISAYHHLPRLPPTKDAEGVAAVLRDPDICGYPANNVRVLCDGEATRQAILDGLEELARQATPDSSAVLYFSGHGSRGGNGDSVPYSYFLMPVDARNGTLAELGETGISSTELTARLSAINAGRLTVLLDCCRAAALAAPGRAGRTDKRCEHAITSIPSSDSPNGGWTLDALGVMARGRGRAVLAASHADGVAYIPESGEIHSLFTSALLRGLRGEATGAGGVLRICDLYDFAQREVVSRRPSQRPVFHAELEDNYPVALRPRSAPVPVPRPPGREQLPFRQKGRGRVWWNRHARRLSLRWIRRTPRHSMALSSCGSTAGLKRKARYDEARRRQRFCGH